MVRISLAHYLVRCEREHGMEPSQLHERVSVMLGSKHEIDHLVRLHAEYALTA